MPRQFKEQVASRPQVQPPQQRAPEQAQVYARPMDALVSRPPAQNDLNGLIEGLKSFNPALEKYSQMAGRADAAQGATDRLGGKEAPTFSFTPYAQGYLEMDGEVKGRADASDLIASYRTEFNKDQPPEALDLFIKGKYADLTKGLPDGPFLSGYNASLAPTLQNLRTDLIQYHQKKVVDTVESNAMQLLDSGIKGYASQGQQVPDTYIEGLRTKLGTTMGVNTDRFDQLLFDVVNRAGNDGHMDAFDLLRRPRADGTPGMYFNPDWKHKVDSAELEAANRSERKLRMQREDRQDEALYGVFDTLYNGDAEGARNKFDGLRKAGLFTRASDLKKWEDSLAQATTKEAGVGQQAIETELLSGIYTGRVGLRNVLAADLTYSQKKSLLGEVRRVQQENRMATAAEEKEGKAIFRTPEYTSGEKYIAGALSSTANPMDVMGVGTQFERQQRAAAILEFTRRAQGITNPVELNAVREDIVDRYLKRRKQLGTDAKELPSAGLVRYSTPAEAADAARKGLLSADELTLHLNFFKSQRQPKAVNNAR